MTSIERGDYVDADPGRDLSAAAVGDVTWAPMTLPCDVHRQLVRDGRITDPDDGDGNDACSWVQDRAWWFRFELPPVDDLADDERLTLVCDAVDTRATFWLAGQLLGRHDNLFRPVSFVLRPPLTGTRLTVRIDPPQRDADGTYRTSRRELRKPAYGYGWDFAPVRPSVGIGSVRLLRERAAAIESVVVRTLDIGNPACLRARVDVDAFTDAPVEVRLQLSDPVGDIVASVVTSPGQPVDLRVPNPHLWWSHGHGEPALYVLETRLMVGPDIVDERRQHVGIRTVGLDRSPNHTQAGGEHFRFVLNGRPVAALGANWVPTGMSAAVPDETRVARLLALARDAGMSMLRVWGGGYYECDAFYDRCDRLGILVWQDFMFANDAYPAGDGYLAEVEAEARHQVRRLSQHPSLALWCGNNEIELTAALLDQEPPSGELFHGLLPRIVAEESDLDYVGSSPCAGNSPNAGDRHNWQVWHGLDVGQEVHDPLAWSLAHPTTDPGSPEGRAFVTTAHPRRYLEDETRFASEYGLASYPWFATLAARLTTDQLRRSDEVLANRSRPSRFGPLNKMDLFMAATVGLPDDLPDYIRRSQLMQAEGVKLATEHYRRQWPTCSGALLWQLGDCWPAVSWSLVDGDLRPKPAWWYACRFFAPALVSVKEVGGAVELWLTNNSRHAVDERLTVRVTTFDGAARWEAEMHARAGLGESRAIARWTLDEIRTDPAVYLTVEGATLSNRHFFTDIVDMPRQPPSVEVRTTYAGDRLEVTVSSATLALAVTVTAGEAVFDDNCFDLHPWRPVTVRADGVRSAAPVEVAAL